MKRLLFVTLFVSLLAIAGEKYAGTITQNTLNIQSVYDPGNVLADGGCPTDGGFIARTITLSDGGIVDAGVYALPKPTCIKPFFTTTGVQVGSAFVLENASGFCSCQNQTDPTTQLGNCSQSNCLQTNANEKFYSTCDYTEPYKLPALLGDGGAALLSDGGVRFSTVNACTLFVISDAGVKVFYKTDPIH